MGQRVGRISMDLIFFRAEICPSHRCLQFSQTESRSSRPVSSSVAARALKDDPFLVDIAVDKKRTLLGLKALHSKLFGSATGLIRGTKSKKLPKRKSYSKFGRLLLERADQWGHSNLAPLPLS